LVSSTVSPSGAARATASVPITVPAPGRFSTTAVTFWARPICSASTRATMSAPPPAARGTTIFKVRAVCASASRGDADARHTASNTRRRLKQAIAMLRLDAIKISNRGLSYPMNCPIDWPDCRCSLPLRLKEKFGGTSWASRADFCKWPALPPWQRRCCNRRWRSIIRPGRCASWSAFRRAAPTSSHV